jgi:hypothetical protein
MERWRPAGPWSGLHFAAEKAANGTTATQICVHLRSSAAY